MCSEGGTVLVKHVNTGVTHLELCGAHTRVHCLNSPPHLPVLHQDGYGVCHG